MVSLCGRGFDSRQLHTLLSPAGHSTTSLPPLVAGHFFVPSQ